MRRWFDIGLLGALVAGPCCLQPQQAAAQALGTYSYKAGRTTGTMTVSDVSACRLKDALGCMSAARPLKIAIKTLDGKSGNDCDVDAVEETVGRVAGPSGLKALLTIQDDRSGGKPGLSVTFDKAGDLVELVAGADEIGCGVGVGYLGRWRRKSKG